MGKKTKALSGASQDAYFRRVLKTQLELKVEDRDRLVNKLREDIAQLRLRKHGSADPKPLPSPPPSAALPPPFDPFSPNVVVVVRTSGRDAALAALGRHRQRGAPAPSCARATADRRLGQLLR